MKWIVAIIQPHRLDAVRDALNEIGIQGLTVTEVRGYGRQKGQTEIYRGAEYQISYLPKLKLELAVDSKMSSKVVDAIRDAAKTGKIGDGKVFIMDLQSALRIRTEETGSDAL